MALAFGGDETAGRWFARQAGWWEGHFVEAVDAIVDFLAGDGVSLRGSRVIDVGCGDGILSLGLARRSGASHVLGVDIVDVDEDFLADMSDAHGIGRPAQLSFASAPEGILPADSDSMDVAVTWSVLEHVADLDQLLQEVRRVLRSDGLFFAQVWPLFYSEHGSHLWNWLEPFGHLVRTPEALRSELREKAGPMAPALMDLYDSCNRATVDDVGQALRRAGFFLAKVELTTNAIHIPPALQSMPLSQLSTTGFKILAVNQKV